MRPATASGIAALAGPVAVVTAVAVLSSCGAESPPPAARTARSTVAHVIDGDTVALRSGQRVRLIGIDTPERGDCGYEAATQALRRLVEGRQVVLANPASVQDRDAYDRLLRYVDVQGTDAGLAQIEAGLAQARYDSRDGYDPHPRQARYRAADRATADICS